MLQHLQQYIVLVLTILTIVQSMFQAVLLKHIKRQLIGVHMQIEYSQYHKKKKGELAHPFFMFNININIL